MADTRTRAQRNRAIRQDEIRAQISAGKHHLHLVESFEEIDKAKNKLALDKIKLKNEIRAKLLAKYVGDVKTQEIVDNTPQNVTFAFFSGDTVPSKPIQGATIDAKAIEYDDKGDSLNVDESVPEKVISSDER